MQKPSLLKAVFCLIIITSCYEQKALSFTFQRGAASNKHHLLPSENMDFVFDGDLPTKFIRKLNKNIEILETSKSTIDLDLKAMESLPVKGKTNQKEDEAPATVHSILNGPTNTMRAYLRSKTGPFLRMDPDGSLGGTKDMQDKNVVFIVERMSKDAVRLKGEAANKYICITKKQKIITKENPNSKCLLRSYLEENHYELFWSYSYSKKTDGEDGWFLALKHNGKVRKPSKTKLGDEQTMFFVYRADDMPDT